MIYLPWVLSIYQLIISSSCSNEYHHLLLPVHVFGNQAENLIIDYITVKNSRTKYVSYFFSIKNFTSKFLVLYVDFIVRQNTMSSIYFTHMFVYGTPSMPQEWYSKATECRKNKSLHFIRKGRRDITYVSSCR